MPPYNIYLKIQYPSGTNLANVNAICRIESTNESKTLTTNSNGEVVFGLGNTQDFPTGFKISDKITVFSLYQGFQQIFSFSIPGIGVSTTVKDNSGVTVGSATGGGLVGTLVLVVVPTAPTLRYFKPQEFLDFFDLKIYEDDNDKGVKLQQMVLIGESVESDIDSDCNTVFDNNSGSFYSYTEYIDTNEFNDEYFISKKPISSMTNLYTTQNDEDTTPDYTNNTTEWDSLTENTHYIVDTTTGRIVIVNSSCSPISRRWGLYASYKYGRSSVPKDIRMLAIYDTAIRMGLTAVTRAKMGDKNATSVDFMDWFQTYRNRILNKYREAGIRNT